MPENKLKNSTIKNIAVTRGLAFALVTAVYIYMDNTLSGCCGVYMSAFFFRWHSVQGRVQCSSILLSALIGYGWAFLYVNLGGWLSAVFPVQVKLCIVIAEFALTCHFSFVYSSKISVKYKA